MASVVTGSWRSSHTLKQKRLSFLRNFCHSLHRKLSYCQLSVKLVTKMSSKWLHSRFSASINARIGLLLRDNKCLPTHHPTLHSKLSHSLLTFIHSFNKHADAQTKGFSLFEWRSSEPDESSRCRTLPPSTLNGPICRRLSDIHFLNINIWSLINISLKCVARDPIDNNSAFNRVIDD